MHIVTILIAAIGGIILGSLVQYFIRKKIEEKQLSSASSKAEQIIQDTNNKKEEIKRKANIGIKERELEIKEQEKENKHRWGDLQKFEKRLIKKEENIDKKGDLLNIKDGELTKRERQIQGEEDRHRKTREKYKRMLDGVQMELEKVAHMTRDDAKSRLYESLIDEVKHEAAKKIKEYEDQAKLEAEKRAKRIVSNAIMRYSGEYVQERTVSIVNLPNDEMKGRIIGREGRNIKAFENITGVDLIIDNTPESVVLSAFNPVRREVAKIALEKLITDGRIHPSRIEEIVRKTEKEVEQSIKEAGDYALFELGIHNMHPELVKLIGSLKYRLSYAQNVYFHSLETGHLAGLLCAELGLDVRQGKRAGLLHDIGKAVDYKIEGPHATIGADFARKYGEAPEIVNAIASHHEDEKPRSIMAVLVASADALSGARPGARREMLESYIKRIESLEAVATEFDGVDKSYAVQAGRELRVIVKSDKISDDHASVLARDIAKKIEESMTYPGQIKVSVIREMRSVAYAK